MSKAISTLIAAAATLALSGTVYAQAGGASNGSSHGSTSSPATNQMNGSSNDYGTPGTANSDSGMAPQSPGMSMQQSPNNTSTPAPKSNNTLATPSTKSPAGGQ
jgi:hypothetical protein